MQHAILIGDSIRLDYQPFVQAQLSGQATVTGPAGNGGNSRELLAEIEMRVIRHAPDLVHINCGLHDIKRAKPCGPAAVSLDEYADNLRRIFTRLRNETDAVLVWATTTPVNDERHAAHKPFTRRLADVLAYNETASRIARESGLAANDLFAVVTTAGSDGLLLPDGVHFTVEGRRVLATAVADCIRRTLPSRTA